MSQSSRILWYGSAAWRKESMLRPSQGRGYGHGVFPEFTWQRGSCGLNVACGAITDFVWWEFIRNENDKVTFDGLVMRNRSEVPLKPWWLEKFMRCFPFHLELSCEPRLLPINSAIEKFIHKLQRRSNFIVEDSFQQITWIAQRIFGLLKPALNIFLQGRR